MTIIHAKNIVLENIYVNSTDIEHPVDFDFSSLNVRINRPRKKKKDKNPLDNTWRLIT